MKTFSYLCLLSLLSCIHKLSCEESEEQLRQVSLQMVVTVPDEKVDKYFKIQGIDPKTKKGIYFSDLNVRYLEFYKLKGVNAISKGDTLIKLKNTNFFVVRRKDRICRIEFKCGVILVDSMSTCQYY